MRIARDNIERVFRLRSRFHMVAIGGLVVLFGDGVGWGGGRAGGSVGWRVGVAWGIGTK